MLVLHLAPYRIRCLDACLDGVVDAHAVQLLADGACEILEEALAVFPRLGQLFDDLLVFFRMFIPEAQVFEFFLDFVKPEPVGQRGVNIERFARNLILFVGRLRTEGAHVVQAVGNLDEDDADVIAHGEQELFERLRLGGSLVAEDAARNLGQPVNNLRDFRAEDVGDVFHRVVGVFHHIVQERGANGRGTKPDFATHDLCHCDGVHDVGFPRQAAHSLVGLFGEIEGLGDDFHLLAMA